MRFRWLVHGILVTSFLIAGIPVTANAAPVSGSVHVISGNQWICSHTQPEYILHAGNAYVTAQASSYKFTAAHQGPSFNGVYDTIGYMADLNSGWYCNGHKTWRPPKNGQFGNPVVSAHYITSKNFQGDTGFDIWLEPKASDNTYNAMTTGGQGTEAMIWFSRPDWKYWAKDARWKVSISGRTWYVVASKTGKAGGWERVFFVPASSHNGNVTVSNMRLEPFFTFLMKHGLMSPADVLESLDNGAELSAGSMSLTGYSIKGLAGE